MNPALDSRARFEAAMRNQFYGGLACPSDTWNGDHYTDFAHHMAWQAWQAAIASMTGWLPIETAPEVGNFLVYLPNERDGKRVLPMIRRKNLTTIGDRFAFDCSKPTHWQPLPAPPTPQDPPIAALAAKETK